MWFLLACGPVLDDEAWEEIRLLSPLADPPLDATNGVAEQENAARLGQKLFYDARFSANGAVSCSTCHDPEKGFGDEKTLAEGIRTAGKNAPTALNTAWNRWFFWDGRADSAWSQALGPLENPVEHGSNRMAILKAVYEDPSLKAEYESVFSPLPDLNDPRFPAEARPIPDAVDDPQNIAWETLSAADQDAINRGFSNVGKAIAAYERHLERRDSPFDRFVAGEEDALSPEAQRGLALFVGEGNCTLCHSGPELSDREFHNLALGPREWLSSDPDYGRYAGITRLQQNPFNASGTYSDDPLASKVPYLLQTEEQIGQFKTPSLRNVALTGPYMHGGHFETLTDVIHFYSTLEEEGGEGHREEILIPLDWSDQQIAEMVAFLESLTGEAIPEEWLAP